MSTILTFMFLDWFFWPFALGALLWAYCDVRDKKDDFSIAAGVLITIASCAIIYRYDAIRAWLWNPNHIAASVAAYLFIGFSICLYKWIGKLMDFKSSATKSVPNIPSSYKHGSTSAQEYVREKFGSPYGSVKHDNDRGYYLNWREFPITNWWAYWPLFALGVALDPIRRMVRETVEVLKKFWERLAKRFAVK